MIVFFFFSSRRRHTRFDCDWSSDVCSSDLTVASVPSASIVSLVPAFAATGLPLSGLQLLLGFDRVPDMFRTMTNVFGTLTAATVVDAVESRDQEGHAKTRRTDA